MEKFTTLPELALLKIREVYAKIGECALRFLDGQEDWQGTHFEDDIGIKKKEP